MQSMGDAPYQGCRELFEGLPDDASIVVSTFNSTVYIGTMQTRDAALQRDMQELRRAQGSTKLYDAIISAVNHSEQHPSHTLTLAIITDGQDTASNAGAADAKAAIERLQTRANHRVLFLGSNQDAVLSARTLGIDVGRALTYGSDNPDQMRTAFRSLSSNTSAVRSSGQEVSFTTAQREASVL
jgi:hypothetical protein